MRHNTWMKRSLVLWGMMALFVAVFVSPAGAVPDLQIYIPGATWDPITETWVTAAADFDIQVIGANNTIYGVWLAAALVPSSTDPGSGTITLGSHTYGVGEFYSGTPTMGGEGSGGPELAPHGIYPTSFVTCFVGDYIAPYTDTVYDMQPGQVGSALGEIQTVHATISGYPEVHFDAYNHVIPAHGHAKYRFAPFSHDGGSFVPEPGSLLLLTCGLGGLLGMVRRGRKARTTGG